MTRQDLLLLSDEDLSLLSNKGTVKRARREVEEKTIEGTIAELDDGTVKIVWSDGATCTFSNAERISERFCDCPAVEICRHLIRAVIFYQQYYFNLKQEYAEPSISTQIKAGDALLVKEAVLPTPGGAPASSEHTAPPETADSPGLGGAPCTFKKESTSPDQNKKVQNSQAELIQISGNWNPGMITDQTIEKLMKPAVLKRAQTLFSQGQLVQLMKSKKPLANFLSLGTSIRFLVPEDIRYTYCNCKEEQPCVHVALAIWSFRKLNSESGIIYTGAKSEQVPVGLIHSVESEIKNLVCVGLAATSSMAIAKLKEELNKCAKAKFYASEELLESIIDDWHKYQEVDTRFSEEALLESIAELIIRHDFLLSGSTALPFVMVKGLASERSNLISSTRLIGIGCGLTQKRKHTIISAYFQDEATGTLNAVVQRTADREGSEQPRSYSMLASRLQFKSQSIGGLAQSAILAKGLKLTPTREISFGRNPFLAGAQDFDWAKLKAPVYADSIAELKELASSTAPPYLGLRVTGQKIHVVAIDKVEFASFSILDQAITAQLVDRSGERAVLHHPYMSRGAAGVEKTLKELLYKEQRCIYVSGEVIGRADGLQIRPIGLVFENKAGQRHLCQPWIDRYDTTTNEIEETTGATPERNSALVHFIQDLGEFLSQIVLLGLDNMNEDMIKRSANLLARSAQMGSHLINTQLQCLYAELERKLHDASWHSQQAASIFLKLALQWRIAQEEVLRLN